MKEYYVWVTFPARSWSNESREFVQALIEAAVDDLRTTLQDQKLDVDSIEVKVEGTTC